MRRHLPATPRDTNAQKRAFSRNPSCSCGESFRSLCDFWQHQATEYERLVQHYSHFFEPEEIK